MISKLTAKHLIRNAKEMNLEKFTHDEFRLRQAKF